MIKRRPYIQRHDRVLAIAGHFQGTRGYVCRVHGDDACVVWKGVWDYGIWVPVSYLQRIKRYKSEQEDS